MAGVNQMATVFLMYRGEYEGRSVEGVFTTYAAAERAWRAEQARVVRHWRSFGAQGHGIADAEERAQPDIEEREVVEED